MGVMYTQAQCDQSTRLGTFNSSVDSIHLYKVRLLSITGTSKLQRSKYEGSVEFYSLIPKDGKRVVGMVLKLLTSAYNVRNLGTDRMREYLGQRGCVT